MFRSVLHRIGVSAVIALGCVAAQAVASAPAPSAEPVWPTYRVTRVPEAPGMLGVRGDVTLNNHGAVAGTFLGPGFVLMPYVWQGVASPMLLGNLGGNSCNFKALNDRGGATGTCGYFGNGSLENYQPYLWTARTGIRALNLTALPEEDAHTFDLNDRFEVTGHVEDLYPFVWQRGETRFLARPGDLLAGINNLGVFTGWAYSDGWTRYQAFVGVPGRPR
jgi:hypothetical protein